MPRLPREEYKVGWICALPIELAAAQEMLDEEHEDLGVDGNDDHLYCLGSIAGHNVVVLCLPAGRIGNNPAAAAAAHMRAIFKGIRFVLMVGIGGGVPSAEADIRLGDVVVSQPYQTFGGVVQYDTGKTTSSGFERTGSLNAPPQILLTAVARVRSNELRGRSKLSEHVSKISRIARFQRKKAGSDILFEAAYKHEGGHTCDKCSTDRQEARPPRDSEEEVVVHYGTIASGNQVMRDGCARDKLSRELGGILCFEMEAAGLMNIFPCLIIRGICDYADSHKNKTWQPYAAGTAAAYAKEVLSIIKPADVAQTCTADEAIRNIDRKLDVVNKNIDTLLKIDIAKLPTAKGASFDSHMEEHNSTCLPDTRTDLLHHILAWAKDKSSKPIFWLNGAAGTGKSTIARTVARTFADYQQLGASFFFKKGEGERGNAARFFTTIVTQLAIRVPSIGPGIKRAIDADPAIPEKALKDQFEKLILQPVTEAVNLPTLALLIVIDALDECERDSDIRAILQLLSQTRDLKSVSLRIFVTSRPELPIRLGFKQMPDGTYEDLILHEVIKQTIQHDIRVYFEHELARVRQERLLSTNWPSKDQVEALVERAVPLFIFAATACRYISDPRDNPKKRLEIILRFRKDKVSKLDATYLPILNQLFDEEHEEDRERWACEFQEIVGSIVVLETPLSVASLSRLLRIPKDDISCRLDSLHSVLCIPDRDDVPVRLLHLSFREFLVDTSKNKSPFWVDERVRHKKLASYCLELMSGPAGLRQNMCGLQPGTLRSEVDEGNITSYLSPELQYACRYWVYHVQQSQHRIRDKDSADIFLQKHFLHWLEAMSLMRETNQCTRLVEILNTLVKSSSTALFSFIQDARRFTLRFRYILEEAPLQIYTSALVFTPEASIVRKAFAHEMPGWIKVLSKREEAWDACRSTLEGHTRHINAVAFSPDGHLVASASDDNTVRLWDTATGSCYSTLEGHTKWINAVAFSPDGQLIASASFDKTVRLWGTATGSCLSTLEGHTEQISIAFSPDGHLVASASSDWKVRLWETATGSCYSTLDGHSGFITAVAFSPDGQLVASASYDWTVRLWGTATGSCYSTLDGHSESITALAFSPDGQLVASASFDKTVRLWDTATGSCRSTLEGHTERISAVTFSPDGQLIASASNDWTVRLWGTATGLCYSTLEGHTNYVTAVAFSPDGQLIASASSDWTVRLWDTATGSCYSTLEGYTEYINAVAFSPDGQLIASASDDNTVRLWYTATGLYRSTLEGHTEQISAVAFSLDGQLIASASRDNTVRLWNTATGSCCSMLEGHTEISAVAFAPHRQCLYTNRGDLQLPSTFFASLPRPQSTQSSHIFIQEQWVSSDQQQVLWLPFEYRPICSTVYKDFVCLGNLSGGPTLLKICRVRV